jgi:hypothetical protein
MSGAGGQDGRGKRGGASSTHTPSSSKERRNPTAKTPAESAGGSGTNHQSEEADWETAQTGKQRRFEARQALFKQREGERRANHPELYDLGYNDNEVRLMLDAIDPKDPNPVPSSRGGRDGRGRGRGQHTLNRGGPGRGGPMPNTGHSNTNRGGASGQGGGRGSGGQHTRPQSATGGGGPKRSASQAGRSGAQHTSDQRDSGRSGAPPTQASKRKRDGAVPSGVTPPAKRSSLLTNLSGGAAPTYAQAAAQRKREDFPHMLRVYKGKTDRRHLTEGDFAAVASKLRKRVLAYVKEEDHIMLRTAFIRWSRDAGMIACRNEETKAWYKVEVEAIDLDGVSFRAWDVSELEVLHPARVNITDLGLEPEEILELIKGFNPELKGEITYLRSEKSVDQDIAVLGLDDDMAAALWVKEEPWIVDLGTDQRRVQYSGKQALKERLRAKGLDELVAKLDKATVSGGDEEAMAN